MPIASLSIDRFRNLQPVQLDFSPHLNIFTGENAAGKTSVLEAIFILARGKSFRTHRLDELIQEDRDEFLLIAQLDLQRGRTQPVGMRRASGRLECKIDGKPIKRLSEVAALLPLQWLGGNLHTLIEEGPSHRRQFLDWGLFHVKPDYMVHWKRYQKLLKQRNAALRGGSSTREVEAWNPELAIAADNLDILRCDYLKQLSEVVERISDRFPMFDARVSFSYRRGWKSGSSFIECLRSNLSKDRARGFTQSGPHRAEVIFNVGEKSAGESLSRGQQKVLISTLKLAQSALLHRLTGKNSLFLLDDIGAELDQSNQRVVLELLAEMSAQVFVTSIESLPALSTSSADIRRFHVKHGIVSEVV